LAEWFNDTARKKQAEVLEAISSLLSSLVGRGWLRDDPRPDHIFQMTPEPHECGHADQDDRQSDKPEVNSPHAVALLKPFNDLASFLVVGARSGQTLWQAYFGFAGTRFRFGLCARRLAAS
jgi:hypothetical protein